jgi:hypothetical protein
MKKLLFISLMPFCAYAADYVISPYDDARDHEEVRAIIRNNHEKLCVDANGKPVSASVEQKRPDKLDERLSNNTTCSPLIKPIDPSKSFRIVLRTQHKFVGYASFFENGIEYDAIKKHDGYSSELLTVEEHTEQYPTLIAAMLKKAKEIGIKRFVCHFINNNDTRELPEYKATIAAGFAAQQQTDFEKQRNMVRFEKSV